MYSNIGKKLKILAIVMAAILATAGIFLGFFFISLNNAATGMGFFVLIITPPLAWTSSWVLYGFGELIDKTSSIEELLRESKAPSAAPPTEQPQPRPPYPPQAPYQAPQNNGYSASAPQNTASYNIPSQDTEDTQNVDEDELFECPECKSVVRYGQPKCPNCGLEFDWKNLK